MFNSLQNDETSGWATTGSTNASSSWPVMSNAHPIKSQIRMEQGLWSCINVLATLTSQIFSVALILTANMVHLSSVVSVDTLVGKNLVFPILISERAGFPNIFPYVAPLIGSILNILTTWTSDFGCFMSMLQLLYLFQSTVVHWTLLRIGKICLKMSLWRNMGRRSKQGIIFLPRKN